MVVLASASPRRRELMKRITPSFEVATADIDEETSYNLPPLQAVLDIAKRKCLKVKDNYPNDIVITADTIVVLNDEIIHKPVDAEDAKNILKKLSDKTHQVITAYCINYKNKFIESYVASDVLFNKLSDKLIEDYVATGSPLDKAGAYGVQDGEKFPIVKEVIGSIDNVIGFPVEEIKRDFLEIQK